MIVDLENAAKAKAQAPLAVNGTGNGDQVAGVTLLAISSTPTPNPAAWAHSSVSTFKTRYTPPLPDLSITHSVEALVEGSDMSMLREGQLVLPSLLTSF